MAAPNINSFTTLKFLSVEGAVTNAMADALANAAASGKMIEVVGVYVSNIDGVNACHYTLIFKRAAGAEIRLVYQVSVPAGAVLVPVLKDSPIHIEEDCKIRHQAQNNSDLEFYIAYREYTT